MASGNPFGLAELSHYGTMQRVGGKAAGFINKKFFHPSSLRNQEKLWKAQTAHAVEMRKQADMEKRRDEERQVEELRKQMYLAGQATKSTDFLSAAASSSASSVDGRGLEQLKSAEETRRRKKQLKEEHAAQELGTNSVANPDDASADGQGDPGPQRLLAKSRYREDMHVKGHTSVWGSWFALTKDQRWGYSCCRSTAYGERCILAPAEPVEDEGMKAKRPRTEPRRRRRRRGTATANGAGPTADSSSVTNNSAVCAASAGAAATAEEEVEAEAKAKAKGEAETEVAIGAETEAEAGSEMEAEAEAEPETEEAGAPPDTEAVTAPTPAKGCNSEFATKDSCSRALASSTTDACHIDFSEPPPTHPHVEIYDDHCGKSAAHGL